MKWRNFTRDDYKLNKDGFRRHGKNQRLHLLDCTSGGLKINYSL